MRTPEIKDLHEARHVIRNSFEIKEYQPKGNKDMWDEKTGYNYLTTITVE